MSRYSADSKERVRDAVDFVEVVGARTELRRAGVNRLVGLCPFHDERSPSFGIDPVEKLYHCFGCGAGGDVFKFVMETEGLSFPEALEALAERSGVTLERTDEDPRDAERRARRERLYALLERTAAFYVRMLWESAEAADARAYLESRGLGEDVLRAFRVGYSPASWDRVCGASRRAGFSEHELLAAGVAQRSREGRLIDRFRGRLMFPLCDARGRVLGFGARALREGDKPKYLNSSEGEVFHKGRMVFGVHLARADAAKAGAVVLVEGYTDVLALHQAGIRGTVASMGTALTEDQARELAKLAGTVVLCLDADAAGQEAVAKGAAALRAAAGAGREVVLKVAALPPGSDPADLVSSEGAEGLRGRIDAAVPVAHWQVERALAGAGSSPESRDAALDAVAAIILPMPPSVLKEELIRIVAGRLALSEELAALRLRERAAAQHRPPPRRPPRGEHRSDGSRRWPERRAAGPVARPAPGPAPDLDGPALPDALLAGDPGSDIPRDFDQYGPPPSVDDDPGPVRTAAPARTGLRRGGAAERAFLALCVALPREGARRLAEADLDELFGDPLDRRAAGHLAAHAADPATGVPEGDPELAALIAELVLSARAIEEPSGLDLDRAALHLELARVERAIRTASLEGGPVAELAAERQRVRAELGRLTH